LTEVRTAPVGRDTLLMSAGTLVSRLTGFGRWAALAYAIGFTRLTDAYNLANTTPNIVFDLVLGGVLAATLIPVFVDRLARPGGTVRGEEEAWEAISSVVTLVTVLLVVLTVLFELVAPQLIQIYMVGVHTPAAAAEKNAATELLRMFAPQLALYGWIVLTTALLNTRRRFAAPMFAPILNNVVVIAVLVWVHHALHGMTVSDVDHHHFAFWLLGIGTTAGVLFQLLALLPALRGAGLHLRWRWDPGHEVVGRIVRLSGWTFGFVATNQVAFWVVLLLANRKAGDVSVYTTAYALFQFPYGIVAVSIMSAVQPDLADSWARRAVDSFRDRVSTALRAMTAIIVPATVGYVLLARPAVALVVRHGAAGAADSHRVATVTALLSVGLPGFCTYLLVIRAYQAMQDTRTPFFLYLLENGLNVVLAFAFYPSLGVRGLALALALAYTGAAVVALLDLRERLGRLDGGVLLAHAGRVAVPSVAMGLAVAFVGAMITGTGTGALLVHVVLAVVVGAGVYFTVAGVMAAWQRRRPGP
jgi:putative peptidoglycan lipid II flippase